NCISAIPIRKKIAPTQSHCNEMLETKPCHHYITETFRKYIDIFFVDNLEATNGQHHHLHTARASSAKLTSCSEGFGLRKPPDSGPFWRRDRAPSNQPGSERRPRKM